MAKKIYVEVLGLKKGQAPVGIATVSSKALANWHISNTFAELGYDKLLTRQTPSKGENFVADVVAEDKDSYIKAISTMGITDLGSVATLTERDTLLGLVQKDLIKSKSGLNKIELVETAESEENIENLKKSVQVIYAEGDVFPLSKVEKKLTDALLNALSDDEEDADDEEEPEAEPVKKTKATTKSKVEEKEEVEEADDSAEDSDTGEVVEEEETADEEVVEEEEAEEEIIEEDDNEEVIEEEVEDEEVVEDDDDEDIEEDIDEDIESILEDEE